MSFFFWLAKIANYAAATGVIGSLFISMLSKEERTISAWLRRYCLCAASLGILSTIVAFLLQLLMFSSQGWASFIDWQMYGILLAGKPGLAWGLVLLGFVLCAFINAFCWQASKGRILFVAACLSILISYLFTGHVVRTPWYGQLALLLHVLAVSLWIGALLPLWHINRNAGPAVVSQVMTAFGKAAMGFVSLLLIAGITIMLLLLEELHLLWTTTYGQTLLIKISLVVLLLGLGAINKLVYVPTLARPGISKRLSATIGAEVVTAVLILAVTGWATVIIGLERI